MKILDPNQKYVKKVLHREHCISRWVPHGSSHKEYWIKDLRIFNRNINDIIIVENSPYSYIF